MDEINHDDIRKSVLDELIAKMREMHGERLRPQAVEVGIASAKPEGTEGIEGSPEEEKMESPTMEQAEDGHDQEDQAIADSSVKSNMSNEDDLSEEDMSALEHLFGG